MRHPRQRWALLLITLLLQPCNRHQLKPKKQTVNISRQPFEPIVNQQSKRINSGTIHTRRDNRLSPTVGKTPHRVRQRESFFWLLIYILIVLFTFANVLLYQAGDYIRF